MDTSLQTPQPPLVSCIVPTRNRDFYLRLRGGQGAPRSLRRLTADGTSFVGASISTSPTRLFEDLHEGTFPRSGLTRVFNDYLKNQSRRDRLTSPARDYCLEHGWQGTAERHSALWQLRETHH